MPPLTIAVVGTLDTKAAEHRFVADQIALHGLRPLLVDVSTGANATMAADITPAQLLASGDPPTELPPDRGLALAKMGELAGNFLEMLHREGRLHGVISLGGSCGTSIATTAMKRLPIGVPKVMVSTMAGGNVTRYVDISDVVMIPSVVDVSGLNRISQGVFARAAAAVSAMAQANARFAPADSRPLIVASMFGNTTRCVERARQLLEGQGYEVMVFHATGRGGRTMESLIETGMVSGVLDVTTTEWADQLAGGTMPGGENRLLAAARGGVPAVIAPGCLDMVNFAEPQSVPEHYRHRKFFQHNPQVTLMRTTADECSQLGRLMCERINQSTGPVHVLFPLRAISLISAENQPFHDPQADRALWQSLEQSLRKDIPLEAVDCEINDARFAERAVEILLAMLKSTARTTPTATLV